MSLWREAGWYGSRPALAAKFRRPTPAIPASPPDLVSTTLGVGGWRSRAALEADLPRASLGESRKRLSLGGERERGPAETGEDWEEEDEPKVVTRFWRRWGRREAACAVLKDGLGSEGVAGTAEQTWSPSSASGTGALQFEHLTVGRNSDVRDWAAAELGSRLAIIVARDKAQDGVNLRGCDGTWLSTRP